MNKLLFFGIAAAAIVSTGMAAEIDGKITKVADQNLTISSDSDLLPAVGDKLSVFVEIPGVGKASVATAIVSSIEDEVIRAKIDRATGTVKPGQVVTIQAPNPTKRTKPRDAMASWGEQVDPDGVCRFATTGATLTIEVPAGHYDIYYGQQDASKRFNAPRVLQEIAGDFVAEVKVKANWDLGEAVGPHNFSGAGLLVWGSESEYIRHARNHYINRATETLNSFITPLYDVDGRRVNWKSTMGEFFRGDATWLRVAREGQTISTWLSHDGKTWIPNAVHKTTLPHQISIGAYAINVSSRPLVAEFSGLTIRRGRHGLSLAKVPEISVPVWGKIIDPSGDCIVIARDDYLMIVQPPPTHDLWYGRQEKEQRGNAPRAMHEVEGDFTVQVKVINPLNPPPIEGGRFGGTAGLVVYESDQHYLRQERNRYYNSILRATVSWIPPIYDRDNERVSEWEASRDDVFTGDSTWLFIRRTGQTITTGLSNDGKRWEHLKKYTTSFPNKVQVGVLVHATAAEDYVVRFEGFKLTRP